MFSSFRKHLNILLLIILLIAFSSFTVTMDSYAYETYFNEVKNSSGLAFGTADAFGFDIGFQLITKFISIFIKEYIIYRAVIFLISISIVWCSTVKLLKTDYYPVLLYFTFPFVFDTFQIAFFLSYSIIFCGLCFLITEKSHYRLIFFLTVVLATLIHSSAILFIIFLLYKSNKKAIFRLFLTIVALFSLINLVFRFNIVKLLSTFFPNIASFGKYSSYKLNILTIVLVISHCLALIGYSYYLNMNEHKNKNLFFINILMIAMFPLVFSDLNFERYFRPIILINYCFIINDLFGNIKEKKSFIDTPVDSKFAFECLVVFFSIVRFILHFAYVEDIYNSILQ